MRIQEVTYEYSLVETPFTSEPWPVAEGDVLETYAVHRRMALILSSVVFISVALTALKSTSGASKFQVSGADFEAEHVVEMQASEGALELAPIFSPEIRHWESNIVRWAQMYDVDPDIVAIIMQIESCGDPLAVSGAGAQGLFQVMPFHFADGENSLDPDINARRGLSYFVDRLAQTNGDVGLAFAGYNGGHVAAASGWDDWAAETQRYFVWSTGLYEDAKSGLVDSPTLQQWLAAGGAGLCQQAAGRLGL
jgi:soluble lytic murein transglycosylase-like protein